MLEYCRGGCFIYELAILVARIFLLWIEATKFLARKKKRKKSSEQGTTKLAFRLKRKISGNYYAGPYCSPHPAFLVRCEMVRAFFLFLSTYPGFIL